MLTVPALVVGAAVVTATVPIWLPVLLLADAVRGRIRLPLARLGLFGLCWSWIEVIGVVRAIATFLTGRARHAPTQYALMQWWASALMTAMRRTVGIEPRVEGLDALGTGGAIVLARHASLADSLLSAWAIRCEAGLWPRYVLKRELLSDPCLDIVGLRVPNHFLDRAATDAAAELDALRALASGVADGEVVVIFPEGTRASDAKRGRALARIAERDPARARRLGALRRLLPPRPAGTAALLGGAPGADVVLAWHTGFDGLDDVPGILAGLARPLPPVRIVFRRVPRAEVPVGPAFEAWLDEQWLRMDAEVDAALARSS